MLNIAAMESAHEVANARGEPSALLFAMTIDTAGRWRVVLSLSLMVIAMLAFSASVYAQACPATQPDSVVPNSQTMEGSAVYRSAKLYDQQLNALGTVTLCRYRAALFSFNSRTGAEVPNGTYLFDRTIGATSSSFPPNAWVVRLLDAQGKYVCSGAAITPDWVLTARHCGIGVGPGTEVLAGTDLERQHCQVWLLGGVRKTICTNLPLPAQVTSVRYPYEYLTADKVYWKGGLMLLKLTRPIVLTTYGMPSLNGIDFDSNEDCTTILGCDRTRWDGELIGWLPYDGSSSEPDAIKRYPIKFFRDSTCHTGESWDAIVDDDLCGLINTSAPEIARLDPAWIPRLYAVTGDDSQGAPLVYHGLIVGVLSGNNFSGLAFADVANNGSTSWIRSTVGAPLYSQVLPAQ